MKWIKRIFGWIVGIVPTFLDKICDTVFDRAKQVINDRKLVDIALYAIRCAVREGLTGEQAWVRARKIFVSEAKAAGKDIGDCAIDTTLQLVYDAWKNRK